MRYRKTPEIEQPINLPFKFAVTLPSVRISGFEIGQQTRQNPNLWPTRYADETGDCGFRFLTECWYTNDEASRRVELVPPKAFIEEFTHEWVRCFAARTPMIVEKSRRMVISWAARGLETWVCGQSKAEWLIVDQTHANAAEHLWRVHFALEQLKEKRPELASWYGKDSVRGSVLTREPTHILLPNGSVMTQLHQEAGASQGKGKTGITLEEISKYRAPSAFWNQATLVTMGPGGEPGGWVCGIANADPDPDWRAIKGNQSARALLGME
jgi:hypothetical protein